MKKRNLNNYNPFLQWINQINSINYEQRIEGIHNFLCALQENGTNGIRPYLSYCTITIKNLILIFISDENLENRRIAMRILSILSNINDFNKFCENPKKQFGTSKMCLFNYLIDNNVLDFIFGLILNDDIDVMNDSYAIIELITRNSKNRCELIYQRKIMNYFYQTPNGNFGGILYNIIYLLKIEITQEIQKLLLSLLKSNNNHNIKYVLMIYKICLNNQKLVNDVLENIDYIFNILTSKNPKIVIPALKLVSKLKVQSNELLFAISLAITTPGIIAPKKVISILTKNFQKIVEINEPAILDSIFQCLEESKFEVKIIVMKFLVNYAQYVNMVFDDYLYIVMNFLCDNQLVIYALNIILIMLEQYKIQGKKEDFYVIAREFNEQINNLLMSDDLEIVQLVEKIYDF